MDTNIFFIILAAILLFLCAIIAMYDNNYDKYM